MKLILASTSRYRRALLDRLGIPFECVGPDIDESAWKSQGLSPLELARQLALAKCTAVANLHSGAVVIGSDQVAALDGVTFDKPGTRAGAIRQLTRLSGKTHELITAFAIRRGDVLIEDFEIDRLTLRKLNSAEIKRYVDADEPWDCAGAYKLECRGIALFETIVSCDQTAIQGLPLMAVCQALREFGFSVP